MLFYPNFMWGYRMPYYTPFFRSGWGGYNRGWRGGWGGGWRGGWGGYNRGWGHGYRPYHNYRYGW